MSTCEVCSTVFNVAEFDTCPTCRSRRTKAAGETALLRASDPATSDDELGKLALHDDSDVRAAVYANPNTPQWARLRLSREMDSARTEDRTLSSPRAVSGPPAVTPTRSGVMARNQAADAADRKANGLMSVAATLSILGIIGGILVAVIGLFLLGNEELRAAGIALIAVGLTGVLIWVFIGSFAQTVAAGVKLLAADSRRLP